MRLLFNWNQQPVLMGAEPPAAGCPLEPRAPGKRAAESPTFVAVTPQGSSACTRGCCWLRRQNSHSLARKRSTCHAGDAANRDGQESSPRPVLVCKCGNKPEAPGRGNKEPPRKFSVFSVNAPGQNVPSFPQGHNCGNGSSRRLWG